MTAYREKLESLSLNTGKHKGTTKTTPVAHEDEPRAAGKTTEHWDGKVDATVFAQPVKSTLKINDKDT